MDKITDSLDWKKGDSIPEQYTGPIQEPLDQPTLVSDTKRNQYKQEKQAQTNVTLHSQTATDIDLPEREDLQELLNSIIIFFILLIGPVLVLILFYLGKSIL
jgi:hypothetical protein